MKTLIVEDDFLARSLLSTLLTGFGTCHVAINGAEAVKIFERAIREGVPYDLVLLDIVMPVMDGQQALREMRKIEMRRSAEKYRAARIIMISARDDSESITVAYQEGKCDAYLTKPVDREKLLAHLREFGLLESR